jgi:D-beta-D-heptose 7-phosphate kinase/D-beta-D-heptose 1-phosphate adenosyltransferase
MSDIKKEEYKNFNILVIGDTCTDKFSYGNAFRLAPEAPVPVFNPVYSESNPGMAGNVVANLQALGVTAVTLHNSEHVIKTRYVDVNDKKKHVEINKFDVAGFKDINVNVNDYDVVIVADFGHAFCDKLSINDGFHLMCQTNSNNFGFNRISKWKNNKKKSACIDLREASLQVNKRISNPKDKDILEIYNYELNTEDLFVTSGREGAFYTDGKTTVMQPTFKSDVVDTIGAGDTFFAFACVASHLNYKEHTLLVPSIAASLSTTWLCNEKSVTKKNLLEHAARFI